MIDKEWLMALAYLAKMMKDRRFECLEAIKVLIEMELVTFYENNPNR